MDARGKFGEHKAIAECNSSFLSALQTTRVHPYLDIRTAKSMNKFSYNRATSRTCTKKLFFIVIDRKIIITHIKVNKRAYWLVKNTSHFYLILNLNLRNAQLASFFWLYFWCSLDQDVKSQCR